MPPFGPHFARQNILRPQMRSIRPAGNRHIRSRVNQQSCSGRIPAHPPHRFPSQSFQLAPTEVLLAQLNEVNVTTRCLSDLAQQRTTPGRFIPRKLRLVGDVVEQQSGWSYFEPPTGSFSQSPAWPSRYALVPGPDDTWSIRRAGTRTLPRGSRRT